MGNMLDRMKDSPVPKRPTSARNELHARLNRTITIGHYVDLALRGMPTVMLEFSKAVLGLMVYSVIGKYPTRTDDRGVGSNDTH